MKSLMVLSIVWCALAAPAAEAGVLTNRPLEAAAVRRLVPEVRRALEERLPEHMRPSAYLQLDAQLAREAPAVVYGSFLYSEYFGARVGCEQFPPFRQGVDLGSLCVQER